MGPRRDPDLDPRPPRAGVLAALVVLALALALMDWYRPGSLLREIFPAAEERLWTEDFTERVRRSGPGSR